MVGGLFLWPALRYGTGYHTVWEIRPSAETPSSVHWRRFYFQLTCVHSALGLQLSGWCALQIYLLTYLFTYLHIHLLPVILAQSADQAENEKKQTLFGARFRCMSIEYEDHNDMLVISEALSGLGSICNCCWMVVSIPVLSIAWKSSSPKWPIMFRVGHVY